MSNMRSILNDSDSQCNLETRSNFFPSGSMSLTSKISSNNTPAILMSFYFWSNFSNNCFYLKRNIFTQNQKCY